LGRGYTSVGQMAPFYVFPCGHAFHAQCLIAHVTRCTVETHVSIQIVSPIFMTSLRDDLSCMIPGSLLFSIVPSTFFFIYIFFIKINMWLYLK
jgi:hypothetical protein